MNGVEILMAGDSILCDLGFLNNFLRNEPLNRMMSLAIMRTRHSCNIIINISMYTPLINVNNNIVFYRVLLREIHFIISICFSYLNQLYYNILFWVLMLYLININNNDNNNNNIENISVLKKVIIILNNKIRCDEKNIKILTTPQPKIRFQCETVGVKILKIT